MSKTNPITVSSWTLGDQCRFEERVAAAKAAGFLMGFFAAGGVLQLVTSVAVEMFPKNRAVMTSIVMIASSIANYAVLSIAGLLTSIGGADGPRLIMLFNIAVTVLGMVLAVILNARFDKDFQRETVNN